MEQRLAPSLKELVHPQLLEAPPDRLATPGGGGGKLLAALQPQPGRVDFSKSCTGMQRESKTKRQNWSISCTRGASRSAASRKPTYKTANPLKSEATSALGQTEWTDA